MTVYENRCVSCPPGVPCLGSLCPNRRVPTSVCDICGRGEYEVTLIRAAGRELCEGCAAKALGASARKLRGKPSKSAASISSIPTERIF